MDRRNFLAIIPSLSALPLFSKNIVQKSDKIEIYQPEEVKSYTKQVGGADTYIAVVKEGVIIGTAYMTSLNIMSDPIEVSCRDNGGARAYTHGPFSAHIEAELLGPITNDMIEALQYTFNNQRP